jgi:RNA polymerase sigma factor (sigma-70 family)
MAEDIASETFLAALESWPYKGVPENPVAWLYTVAKNKTVNYVKRRHFFDQKIAGVIQQGAPEITEIEVDLSDANITDSELQMLFAICQPTIAAESQVALALRVLCGFGIDEIASALITNKETINKRLYRAKEKLRLEKAKIVFPLLDDIHDRLENVLLTIYLLFNEGYYSENSDSVLREDLCGEAMRLASLLIANAPTNLPEVNALLSLMCFQSSRFRARSSDRGGTVLYDDQDENLWDQELIAKGAYFLHKASTGVRLTKYHLEAGIAYWHTKKEDTAEKWENILTLFNQLLQIQYSPVAALNRTFALSKIRGKATAIIEAEKLNLTENHYYFALLGELYTGIDDRIAIRNFETAHSIAKSHIDKQTLERKIGRLIRTEK